jgi:MoxR-like ATPase
MADWRAYQGTGIPRRQPYDLPPPPPWRQFDGGPAIPVPSGNAALLAPGDQKRAETYRADDDTVTMVNAALYLRRPLLVTGKPGTGKSSLPYAVAYELNLGPVLRWTITSRSTLRDGLYSYDAIGRLQDVNLTRLGSPGGDGTDPDDTDPMARIGDYVRLGPLGTSLLPFDAPRVILIDEIDKSDIDLPNDLLGLFEHPEYTIDELARIADRKADIDVLTSDGDERVTVHRGRVRSLEFPFVVLTSNGEREFPPAFLRRCLRLELGTPSPEQLAGIIERYLGPELAASSHDLLQQFVSRRNLGELAADQLLNAIYLTTFAEPEAGPSRRRLAEMLMPFLNEMA